MEGRYRFYQARNGKIYIANVGTTSHTALTEEQIRELHICVYNLDDFEPEAFRKAYANIQPEVR